MAYVGEYLVASDYLDRRISTRRGAELASWFTAHPGPWPSSAADHARIAEIERILGVWAKDEDDDHTLYEIDAALKYLKSLRRLSQRATPRRPLRCTAAPRRRRSPSAKAMSLKVGSTSKSRDGTRWIVISTRTGIHRWQRV